RRKRNCDQCSGTKQRDSHREGQTFHGSPLEKETGRRPASKKVAERSRGKTVSQAVLFECYEAPGAVKVARQHSARMCRKP
ncbi:MAG: hypothetical protein KA763_15355, partial [Xanthomonadales bacterium]|nr:hypothetical protein [Xanthomonadales bacterium]